MLSSGAGNSLPVFLTASEFQSSEVFFETALFVTAGASLNSLLRPWPSARSAYLKDTIEAADPDQEMDKPESDIADPLLESCKKKSPVTIMSTAGAFQGEFVAVSSRDVFIDLFRGEEELICKPLSRCCVVFSQQNQSKVFLATVKDWFKPEASTRPLVVLSRVSDIATGESRAAWRVPLRRYSKLSVRFVDEDKRVWHPEAVDISLTGILIKFPKDNAPDLDVGAWVGLELKLNEHEVKLPADVRRRDGRLYGLFFPYDLHGGEITSSNTLRQVVNELERQWLSRHIR